MSARFSILKISAYLTLRFLASVSWVSEKALRSHLLPQLLLTLLNALAPFGTESLGEFSKGPTSSHQIGPLIA